MSIFNSFAALAGGGAEIETGALYASNGQLDITFQGSHDKRPAIVYAYYDGGNSYGTYHTASAAIIDYTQLSNLADAQYYGIRYAGRTQNSSVYVNATYTSESALAAVLKPTGTTLVQYSSSYPMHSAKKYFWIAIWL